MPQRLLLFAACCSLTASLTAATAACGGADSANSAGHTASAAPVRRGTVLVMEQAGRTTTGAAVLGFVHGLHTIVLDGDRVYAGMTRIDTKEGANGARVLTLGGGQTAQLVPSGDAFELRFDSGETLTLREPQPKATN